MQNVGEMIKIIESLAGKYGISGVDSSNLKDFFNEFKVTVPVIGSFNTGKSSAINGLLDKKILPTSITAETSIPTEICYGDENVLFVTRHDKRQRTVVRELRNKSFDTEGVTLYSIELNNEFLKSVKNVKIVDMPGLDSGNASHDKMIRGYIKKSLAYIIMFSADEPLVKESVGDFLKELSLNDIPVYAIMTKCDKIGEDTLKKAKANLKKDLRKITGISDIDVLCLKSKADKDVEPLKDVLLNLSIQANEIADKEISVKLYDKCVEIQTEIAIKLMGQKLDTSGIQQKIDGISRKMEVADGELLSLKKKYDSSLNNSINLVYEEIEKVIKESDVVFEALLSEEKKDPKSVRSMLKYSIKSAVENSYLIENKRYVMDVLTLSEFRTKTEDEIFNCDLSELIENDYDFIANSDENKDLLSSKSIAIAILNSAQENVKMLFDEVSQNGKMNGDKLNLYVNQSFIPKLCDVMNEAVRKELKSYSEKLKTIVDKDVLRRFDQYTSILEKIKDEQKTKDVKRQTNINELSEDLEKITGIISELK